jgi:hypothetical protein
LGDLGTVVKCVAHSDEIAGVVAVMVIAVAVMQ